MMKRRSAVVLCGLIVASLGAAGLAYAAAAGPGRDVPCHIDDQNVLSCPLPPASTVTATTTDTQTATSTVTATETQTVPGPTVTVPGPTTTVPGPTVTVPGPTTTITQTATATLTPTPTPTAPPAGFPNASNTGVPAGTTLTVVTGDLNVGIDGTMIDSKDVRGCIKVTATNVTIQKTKARCVTSWDRSFTGRRVLVQDSLIDCGNTNTTGIAEANITVLRTNITGCENGFDDNAYIDVEDSWIHNVYNGGGAHADGMQMASGHFVAGRVVAGALNITIRHNTIDARDASGAQGTSAIISNSGGDTNIIIDHNLLDGGAFTLYCEQHAKGTNYTVTNNSFGRHYAYGPNTECTDETPWTGNVWVDTGQPVSVG